MNEYLAIDNGGYMCTKSLRINCSIAGCSPEKLRYYLTEQTHLLRISLSNPEDWLDTMLYTYELTFAFLLHISGTCQ